MSRRHTIHKHAAPLTFTNAGDHPVTLFVEQATLTRHGDALEACHLRIHLPWADLLHGPVHAWRIPDAVGAIPPPHVPEQPLTVDLALAAEWLPRLLALGETDAACAAALLDQARSAPELLDTARWRVMRIIPAEAAHAPHRAPATLGADDEALLRSFQATLDELAALAESAYSMLEVGTQTDGTPTSTASSTAAVILAVMAAEQWPIEPDTEPGMLRTTYEGTHAAWQCIGHMRDDPSLFIFYSVAALTIPPARQPAVAEFITRANAGMILGNFELYLDEGQVRYKTSVVVDEGVLPETAVRPVLYGNVDTMDRYLPGLMAVAFGNISPADAIRQCEMPA